MYGWAMPFGDSSREEFILDGVRILRAEAGPCPICGHPTGDCSGDIPPPQRILGTETFPSLGHTEVFVVEEDVYAERWISPFTKTTVLVVRAGAKISLQKARELGLA